MRKGTPEPEPEEETRPRRFPFIDMHNRSAIIGAVLIVLALFWFIWLIVHQFNPGISSIVFPLPGASSNSPTSTPDPLTSAGITLAAPSQGKQPLLNQQQALLLASQLEPEIATRAGKVTEQYTLFTYAGVLASQAGFHNVPVWVIHYTQLNEPPPSTAADPHATNQQHDFYVILDANSGKELLTIWL